MAKPDRGTYSVSVRSLEPQEGYKAEIVVLPVGDGYRIQGDKPTQLGGTGTGPASFDFLTAGLAY